MRKKTIYSQVKQFRLKKLTKRLLFVCSPITAWGGGQQYLYRIFEAISRDKDWNILVIFPNFGEADEFAGELRRIGVNGLNLHNFNHFKLMICMIGFRPHVVHINGLNLKTTSAVLISSLLPGIRNCLTSHLEFLSTATEQEILKWQRKNFFVKLRDISKYHVRTYLKLKLYLKMLDKIIFVNSLYAKKYRKLFGLNKKKIHIVYNGVDTKKFAPNLLDMSKRNELRKIFGITASDFVICGVGGLTHQKRFDIFIKIIARLSQKRNNIKGIIIGDGELKQFLSKLSKDIGVEEKIIFAGYRSDLPRILNLADCFFMPSDDEGLPYALLEAKACGLPSVATRVGGIPEVVRHAKDGMLVNTGNLDEMEGYLNFFISNPVDRSVFSRNARDDVLERFSLYGMQSVTIEILESLYGEVHYDTDSG